MAKDGPQPHFRFRKDASIGAADAEADDIYFSECFLDTGELAALRGCEKPQCIIVGRTGTGKSALIRRLSESEEHVIELAPEVLALNYISNSTILKFLEELGVELGPFYTLLWRHVFTVELLKHKFHISNEQSKADFLTRLASILTRDKAKQKALRYLEEWGREFWKETEYRIREFTNKLESTLDESIGVSKLGIDLRHAKGAKISDEQKGELVTRAQHVVDGVQIKDLHEVMRLLSEDIFDDPKERFYIVIDRLDEEWVDDRIRYRLLRALLEAVRAFRQVKPVKIVLAFRTDLLDRVFRNTRSSGFQEEKYESLYLQIRWSREQLTEILDKRVTLLVREQYTGMAVGIRDILPDGKIEKRAYIDYMLDRTFLRPREAILFVNECLRRSQGHARITRAVLMEAEGVYSRKRLRSLADEWHSDFPHLLDYVQFLYKRSTPFRLGHITTQDLDAVLLEVCSGAPVTTDPIFQVAQQYTANKSTSFDAIVELVRALYQVGVLGIKPDSTTGLHWSYEMAPTIPARQLGPDSRLHIHPTFWRIFGTPSSAS